MTLEQLKILFEKVNHFDRHMGLQLTLLDPGKIQYQLTIQQQHLSSPGTAHGGVLGAMMDCVLGATALSYAVTREQFCSTVEYKTNFLMPAQLGDQLIGTGVLEYIGKSLLVVSGAIRLETSGQNTLALGQGTFNLYPMEKKAIQNWF